jgi:hypothetical protein
MTTPRERAQKSARSAMAKGLTGMVLGVVLMLMFYSPGDQFMFIAAGIGVLGALMYTVASIIAVRTHR